METEHPHGGAEDADEADEFERSSLPPPEPRRNARLYLRPPRPPRRRRWRFWAIPAAAAIIVTLLQGTKGSTIAQSQPPIQIAAGLWQRIPLPATDGRAIHTIAPSPTDPNTIYACVGPILGSAYPSPTGPAWLFRTRDAGVHWDVLPTPTLRASWCSVQVSPTQPGRITVAVHDGTQYFSGAPACAETTTYMSDDAGETWQTLPQVPLWPTDAAYASCTFWQVGGARFAFISYGVEVKITAGAVTEPYTLLERSEDGGRTWQRADAGLPAQSSFWRFLAGGPYPDVTPTDDTMVVALLRYGGGGGTAASAWEIWRTDDAGRNWRHLSTVRLPPPDEIAHSVEQHPGYIVSGDQLPAFDFDISVLQLSPDYRVEGRVPPLPVPRATPDRTGLLQVLGATPDGRILALGVSLDRGVPPLPSPGEPSPNLPAYLQSSWVWIWNPAAARWGVVRAPLVKEPGRVPYGCGNCWESHLTRGSERDVLQQKVAGQYVWLHDWEGTESAAYRLFVADPIS